MGIRMWFPTDDSRRDTREHMKRSQVLRLEDRSSYSQPRETFLDMPPQRTVTDKERLRALQKVDPLAQPLG
jgi:hypothetical protein